jgi:hypothetical protein
MALLLGFLACPQGVQGRAWSAERDGRSALHGPRSTPVTVPFELLKSKHIAVKIKINGKGPYRVIFDTGAPMTLINNRIAKDSGAMKKVLRPILPLWGAGGQVRLDSLQVGDAKVKNTTAIVMDHPTVEHISKVLGPIEGLVGFPFFGRFALTIDYQAKTLTFLPTNYEPPDVMKKLMKTLMERDRPRTQVLAPAAQWGLRVDKDAKDTDPGVNVREVLSGSAAARAGLRAGDRLLSLDGRWTDSVAECYGAAGPVKPGTAAHVRIRRGGKDLTLTVTPVTGI